MWGPSNILISLHSINLKSHVFLADFSYSLFSLVEAPSVEYRSPRLQLELLDAGDSDQG